MKYGRWNCLIWANVLTIASCGIQMVYKNFAVFNIGRVLYGLAVGGFSVFSNCYVSEFAPKEISGPAGAIFQVSVVTGGLIPTAFGLVDIKIDDSERQKEILTMLILTPTVVSVI